MRPLLVVLFAVSVLSDSEDVTAQPGRARSHAIYMTAVEIKGSTTSDKVRPPQFDPRTLSRGYAYKGPGQADSSAPQRWEVSSYQFNPVFVTVQQGDSIMLSVFIANGDHHEMQLIDPEGESVIAK